MNKQSVLRMVVFSHVIVSVSAGILGWMLAMGFQWHFLLIPICFSTVRMISNINLLAALARVSEPGIKES